MQKEGNTRRAMGIASYSRANDIAMLYRILNDHMDPNMTEIYRKAPASAKEVRVTEEFEIK